MILNGIVGVSYIPPLILELNGNTDILNDHMRLFNHTENDDGEKWESSSTTTLV